MPIAPNWTARGEYLWTGYPNATVSYPDLGQRISSNLNLQEFRLGLNYHFNGDAPVSNAAASLTPFADMISLHGQATFTEQAYPSFRSPYAGTNSLDGTAQGRETIDATLYAGFKLWQGAEFWFNPEIDQGFGFDNTHGLAGFPSAESYKLGSAYPYARVQRAFVRQTINLGGDVEKVDEDVNQFAGTRSADRLVLTVGRFGVNDIFDTNKYANNPKTDFLNWTAINAGTFDYAGDGWGYTYGAAAEWYTGRWTLRAGVFDLSATPAGGVSPLGAMNSIRPSRISRWSEKSRSATSCGGNRARSRSPRFSAAAACRNLCRRDRAGCGDRPARQHQCRSLLHQPARRQRQP